MKTSRLLYVTSILIILLLTLSFAGCKKQQVREEDDDVEFVEETIPGEPGIAPYDYGEEASGDPDFGESSIMGENVSHEFDLSQAIENLENIYFEFDKSTLTGAAKSTLRGNAEIIKSHPNLKVRIEGHCDERGTEEYNLALGERRASSAYRYLKALGVSGDQISIISYGESRPVDTGQGESAWSKNRRGHFAIISR